MLDYIDINLDLEDDDYDDINDNGDDNILGTLAVN